MIRTTFARTVIIIILIYYYKLSIGSSACSQCFNNKDNCTMCSNGFYLINFNNIANNNTCQLKCDDGFQTLET